MSIRQTEEKDLARIAEIDIFTRRVAHVGLFPEKYNFNETVVERFEKLKKSFNEQGRNCFSFVFDDGIVKGYADGGVARCEDKKGSFQIYDAYIEPVFQGQGIGSQLMLYLEKIAKGKGYSEIVVWSFEKAPSTKFYEKCGFILDGKSRISNPSFDVVSVRHTKQI